MNVHIDEIEAIRRDAQIELLEEFFEKYGDYPKPNHNTFERRLHRYNRMITFYEEKIPDAPEHQAKMFTGFTSSLRYFRTLAQFYKRSQDHIIGLHDRLVELKKEADHEPEA